MADKFVLYVRKVLVNPLMARKQCQIEVVHPELGGVSKAQLVEKLAKQFKVKEDQVTVYGVKAAFGGCRSSGFALIYDSHDLLKKYDSKKQLRKVSLDPCQIVNQKRVRVSVVSKSKLKLIILARHPRETQGRTQGSQGAQEQSQESQGYRQGKGPDRQEEEVSTRFSSEQVAICCRVIKGTARSMYCSSANFATRPF